MKGRPVLRRVDDHLREKRRKPAFRDLQELDEEKLKVAKVIVGERIQRGLSQAALAKQLGVTQQQVSKLEDGDFDNLATLQKALTALGYQVKVSAIRLHRQDRAHLVKN